MSLAVHIQIKDIHCPFAKANVEFIEMENLLFSIKVPAASFYRNTMLMRSASEVNLK